MQQSQAIGFSMGDIKKMSGSLLPVGILALVGMLVLPLPVVLLDIFFVFNITISLLILMVALHTHRPLDFSSFPNLTFSDSFEVGPKCGFDQDSFVRGP